MSKSDDQEPEWEATRYGGQVKKVETPWGTGTFAPYIEDEDVIKTISSGKRTFGYITEGKKSVKEAEAAGLETRPMPGEGGSRVHAIFKPGADGKERFEKFRDLEQPKSKYQVGYDQRKGKIYASTAGKADIAYDVERGKLLDYSKADIAIYLHRMYLDKDIKEHFPQYYIPEKKAKERQTLSEAMKKGKVSTNKNDETVVKKHLRQKPKGGKATVRRHTRKLRR